MTINRRPRAVASMLALALLALLGPTATPTAGADPGATTESAATATGITAKAVGTSPVIPYVVPEGAIFTRPRDAGGTLDTELSWNHVVEHLLDATPAGATVTGSLFSLTSAASQAALKRADKRGVKVRMLLYNRRADYKSVRKLVHALNDGKTKGSWAKVCRGSCYGRTSKKINKKTGQPINPGVQHFKAFTFSTVMETSTTAATNVWTAGSGNLTGRGSGFNSYVVKKNSPAVFAALNKYMVGMRADRESRPSNARTVEEGVYKLYLYPQQKVTPDVVYDTLKHTSCVAPAGYGLNGRTVVRVGMFTWTQYRKLDVQLVRLKRAGCDVQVVVSGPYVEKAVMKRLVRAKIPVSNAFHKHGKSFYYLHDKNLVIDGTLNGVATSQVLTGSNNFTDGGMSRNTESIIRIRDRAVTTQFLTQWSLIQSYSKPITRLSQLSQLSAQSATPLDPENMEVSGR